MSSPPAASKSAQPRSRVRQSRSRPAGDYLDEAGQSCARALFKRPLGATRVWSWRVLGSRWRRHADPSALAHCRGRVRRRVSLFPSGNDIGLGVNGYSELRRVPLSISCINQIHRKIQQQKHSRPNGCSSGAHSPKPAMRILCASVLILHAAAMPRRSLPAIRFRSSI